MAGLAVRFWLTRSARAWRCFIASGISSMALLLHFFRRLASSRPPAVDLTVDA